MSIFRRPLIAYIGKLWNIAAEYGIPNKSINIMKDLYKDSKCSILMNNGCSERFAVNTGVKQGCILSPFLFVLTIDWVMRKCTHDDRSIKWSEATTLQYLDFMDDLALLCHSYDNQQELTDALARAAGTVGLLISTSKTKLMKVNAEKGMVKFNGEDLEIVEEFTYLGSKMSADGNTIREQN